MKTLREARREFMRTYLNRVLREAEGSRTKAAKIAGMNRTHFQALLHRHGLVRKYTFEECIGNAAWRSLPDIPRHSMTQAAGEHR